MAVRALTGQEVAQRLEAALPDAVERWEPEVVWVHPGQISTACRFLRDDPELDFRFLSSLSAVDFIGHFDLVYHLTSLGRRHTAVVKARLYGRDTPSLPSVYPVWQGADFQEREVWDLMGVRFEGHPNLKRIMLWEGFEGHPLRKDFL
ncbi:MAG: NADH-quinone oxidoreductase subunit C [Dehalococcoidia bacterium]|nr:NADH-quinone oxidoreductase subunit C [Dehalococcoidia bacterium]MSQ16609.1 NADH-quinone oxidoreductase subunit C [Dehalococcoidia bacterium]